MSVNEQIGEELNKPVIKKKKSKEQNSMRDLKKIVGQQI